MFGKIIAGACALVIGSAGMVSASELRVEVTDSEGVVRESRTIQMRLASDFNLLEATDKLFQGAHRERLENGPVKETMLDACKRLFMVYERIQKRDRLAPINGTSLISEGEVKIGGIYNGIMSVCEGRITGGRLPDFNAGATPAGQKGCTEHGTATNDEGTPYDVTEQGGCF